MSDAIMDDDGSLSNRNDETAERRRSLRSLAAALGIHAAILAAFALGLGAIGGSHLLPPVTIELQGSGPGPETTMGGGGAGSSGGGTSAAAAAGPVAAVPSAAASSASAAAAKGASSGGSGANDFVIPAPRGASGASPSAAAGPAFRESGGRTGVAAGIPSTSSPLPGPAVAPVQQGKSGGGSGTSSGSGASSVQRSGTGVAVGGSSAASGGSLDLGKLDKALASGGSAGGAAGGGAAGSGAGSATGGSGSGGSGSGTGSGSGSGTAGGGTQSYSVDWGASNAGKGRRLLSAPSPTVPSWVEREGLPLNVTVSFTLLSDGVIGGAVIQRSSGYADVDAAVMDAIRRWRFTAAENAPPVKGIIPYAIRPR